MEKTGESQPQQQRSALLSQLLRLKLWLVEHFPVGERQFMLVWAALIGLLGAAASELFRRSFPLLPGCPFGKEWLSRRWADCWPVSPCGSEIV
jgi:hypothetical protein